MDMAEKLGHIIDGEPDLDWGHLAPSNTPTTLSCGGIGLNGWQHLKTDRREWPSTPKASLIHAIFVDLGVLRL